MNSQLVPVSAPEREIEREIGTPSLLGMTLEQLTELLDSPARARATLKWLWGAAPLPRQMPDSIPGVNTQAWKKLRASCQLGLPQLLTRLASQDGTIKYLFQSHNALYETVLIPGRGRSTLCLSSQSGCSRRCAFCATGQLGLRRNLRASELVGQLLATRADALPHAPLRNVVFMGMGEPLDNIQEVLHSIRILNQSPAPQISLNHITVSTCGSLKGLSHFLKDCSAPVAISLHATTDEQRNLLMPHNIQEPISDLLNLLRAESQRSGRLFFFEYIMFDQFNDSAEDAHRLLVLLQGIHSRVNLIAHNSFTQSMLHPSPPERILAFQQILHQGKIRCLIRAPRGKEIGAACGQLALNQAQSFVE